MQIFLSVNQIWEFQTVSNFVLDNLSYFGEFCWFFRMSRAYFIAPGQYGTLKQIINHLNFPALLFSDKIVARAWQHGK
jgi:hypothetical protein